MSIIERFRQWVSHRMDAHWRRQKVALRKKQNVASALRKRQETMSMYLERQHMEEWRVKKNLQHMLDVW